METILQIVFWFLAVVAVAVLAILPSFGESTILSERTFDIIDADYTSI